MYVNLGFQTSIYKYGLYFAKDNVAISRINPSVVICFCFSTLQNDTVS